MAVCFTVLPWTIHTDSPASPEDQQRGPQEWVCEALRVLLESPLKFCLSTCFACEFEKPF